jgi:O-antigen ligase
VFTSTNNYWAFQFFRGMVVMVMLFLLTVNFVGTKREFRLLIGVLIAAHVFLSLKGIGQFLIGNEVGTTGVVGGNFLGDENDFALALIVIFPFAYFAVGGSRTGKGKVFWSLLVLLFLTTIMLTMSRGGFLGIAATLLVCWARSGRKALGLLALLIAVAAVALLAPDRYFEEIRSIRQTDEGTALKRREYWMAGIRMFAEKPLIGVGPGNSKIFMPQYVDLPHPNQQWGRAMHGTLPLLLAEMGAAGFLIFTVLAAQSARDLGALRKRRFEDEEERRFDDYVRNAVTASAIGFLVTSTFLSALYYPHIYVLAAFAAIGRRATQSSPGGVP